ncbi:putative membrane protein [Microvirga lotononidis]|uniref:Putative membrane protein n=2 Tax=Microvirga lotononidis TaxID=864069 RepID=I4YY26_9HYPH|nr:putative membrane protein [Microvirga lotononidis]
MPSPMRQTDVTATTPQARTAASQRWDSLDVARGLAIGAMIVYHFSWDLSFLQLIGTNILQVPAWRWFARGIAGSFLMLAGFGLALAHIQGFRRIPFLKRLLRIGGAALAVTLGTYFAFPESYIFFGILHCIAVSSVLALPFLRLHPALTLAAAAFFLIGPWLFTSPALDAPWLDWLGLGAREPVTNDYVPIFPWFGLVLIGTAGGKLMLARRESLGLARWRADNPVFRLLTWAGRKSLPIYLTHQIVLLGILFGVAQIVGPSPAAACRQICLMQNGDPGLCPSVCSCILQQVPERGLWQRLLANKAEAEDNTRVSRAAQQCMRQTPPS